MKLLLAIATIIGTVIGAGILGLPYAISVSGFIPGVILIIIIGFAMTMLLLYLGEVVLRCKRVLQVPGLVKKYLGVNFYWITLLMFILSIYGALISYIIGVGDSVNSLMPNSKLLVMLLFTALVSWPVVKGVHLMDKVQLVLVSSLVFLLLVISFSIIGGVDISNLFYFNPSELFFPFGVIFFALTGYSVMPELEIILLKHERLFLSSVIIAMISCVIIYIIFSGVFIGVFGSSVTEVSTQSLSGWLGFIGNLIAIFGMATSFMGLGVALSDVFKRDVGFSNSFSWFLVCIVPFLFAVLFNPSFIQPILISGAFTGTLTGLIILRLWVVARRKRGVRPAFTAPFGFTGLFIVAFILITGLVMTFINLL